MEPSKLVTTKQRTIHVVCTGCVTMCRFPQAAQLAKLSLVNRVKWTHSFCVISTTSFFYFLHLFFQLALDRKGEPRICFFSFSIWPQARADLNSSKYLPVSSDIIADSFDVRFRFSAGEICELY